MTVCAAWVRTVGDHEELLVASDSRLSGGRAIDYCPKLLVLPRSDSAICFAGSTDLAYPLMLQLSLAVEAHGPSRLRVMDFRPFVTHAVKVFNSMAGAIRTTVSLLKKPDVSFLIGGYSWRQKQFEVYQVQYRTGIGRFAARRVKPHRQGFGLVAFAGDVRKEAERQFFKLMLSRYPKAPHGPVDMEPFEVIRDMLRNAGPSDSIGGAPQLAKVYPYMNATTVGVFWPDRESGVPTLQGRPVMGFEKIDKWIIDPDTLWLSHQSFSRRDDSHGVKPDSIEDTPLA